MGPVRRDSGYDPTRDIDRIKIPQRSEPGDAIVANALCCEGSPRFVAGHAIRSIEAA
jgi:hypothetical protein